MKVLAQLGEGTVLVDVGDAEDDSAFAQVFSQRRGVMVDLRRGRAYPPRFILSHIAHGNGYWQPFTGDPGRAFELAAEMMRHHTASRRTSGESRHGRA